MSPRLSLLTISEFEDTVGSDALADTLARFFLSIEQRSRIIFEGLFEGSAIKPDVVVCDLLGF